MFLKLLHFSSTAVKTDHNGSGLEFGKHSYVVFFVVIIMKASYWFVSNPPLSLSLSAGPPQHGGV